MRVSRQDSCDVGRFNNALGRIRQRCPSIRRSGGRLSARERPRATSAPNGRVPLVANKPMRPAANLCGRTHPDHQARAPVDAAGAVQSAPAQPVAATCSTNPCEKYSNKPAKRCSTGACAQQHLASDNSRGPSNSGARLYSHAVNPSSAVAHATSLLLLVLMHGIMHEG